jgi:hypothetical protein
MKKRLHSATNLINFKPWKSCGTHKVAFKWHVTHWALLFAQLPTLSILISNLWLWF